MSKTASLPHAAPTAAVPRRSRLWPGIVFLFIGLQIIWMSAVLYFATSDRSFAVEPDYYAKAVDWDGHQRQAAQNAELGWTVNLRVGHAVGDKGLRAVQAQMTDAQGAAISDATVGAEFFHRAHGQDWQRADFAPSAATPGLQNAMLAMPWHGVYEFRVRVEARGEVYTQTVLLEVAAP